MNVEIEKDQLRDVVSVAARIAGRKSTHPITGALRFQVVGQALVVGANDYEKAIEIRTSVASTDGDGAVAIPAALFEKIVNSLEPGKATLRRDGNEFEIRAGRTRFRLTTLPVEDFPDFPRPSADYTVVIPDPAKLAGAFGQVVPAASSDDARPTLTGVNWSIDPEGEAGHGTLVATDSYSLSRRFLDVEREGEAKDGAKVIVPADAVAEVARLLPRADGAVRIAISPMLNSARFSIGDSVEFSTRLIEGEFPGWQRLMPVVSTNVLLAGRAELREALARVAVVTGPNTPVKLSLGQSLSPVELSSVEAGVGEAREFVETASYEGEPMAVAVNPRFLDKALDTIPTEKVRLEFASATKPVRVVGDGDEDLVWLVMPIRLKQ